MSSSIVTPFSALEEMIVLLAGMTKTVSRYRLLSVHLGTTVDCRPLREEMTALRNKMLQEVRHSRENFVTSCKEKEIGPEQDEADRLFCVYLAGIELFTQELLRTLDLYKVFTGPDLLLATGMQDYLHMRSGVRFGVRGRKGSNAGMEANNHASFPEEVEDMFMAIDEIKEALADLQASVSIAPWTMTTDTDQVVPNKFGSHSSLVSSLAEEPSKTVSVTHSAATSASHTREIVSRAASGENHHPVEHEVELNCCARTRKARIWIAGGFLIIAMSAIVLLIIVCISVVTPRTDFNGTNSSRDKMSRSGYRNN